MSSSLFLSIAVTFISCTIAFISASASTTPATSTSPTYGSVELQACSTGNCTNGTCHTRVVARENVCLNEFYSGISQKFKCMYQGKTNQKTGQQNLCITERYWYLPEVAPCDNKKPHAFAQSPCGRCAQTQHYKFAMITGCENGLANNTSPSSGGFVKFTYNCEYSDCTGCANTMTIPTRQCVFRGDRMFAIDDVYPCETVVEMNSYNGFGCSTLEQKGPTHWLVPGNGACYSDRPNYGTQLLCQEKPPEEMNERNAKKMKVDDDHHTDEVMLIKDEQDGKLLKEIRKENERRGSSFLFNGRF